MENALSAALYIAFLGGFYGLFYYLNHRTPKPAGCEALTAACNGCSLGSCGNHPSQNFELKEN